MQSIEELKPLENVLNSIGKRRAFGLDVPPNPIAFAEKPAWIEAQLGWRACALGGDF